MTKEILYLYLGTNGSILSPVHLEDVYYVRKVRLIADDEKTLTKDGVNFVRSTIVPEDEVELWKEV
jgi:hypothetical protein